MNNFIFSIRVIFARDHPCTVNVQSFMWLQRKSFLVSHNHGIIKNQVLPWWPSWVSGPHKNANFVREHPMTISVQIWFNHVCSFLERPFIYITTWFYVKSKTHDDGHLDWPINTKSKNTWEVSSKPYLVSNGWAVIKIFENITQSIAFMVLDIHVIVSWHQSNSNILLVTTL